MRLSDSMTGTHRARVTKRSTIETRNGHEAIELTFRLEAGAFRGREVTGRFYTQVLLQRARALQPKELVDVEVTTKRLRNGRRVLDVRDFRSAGEPTVVEFINGVHRVVKEESPLEDSDEPQAFFGPMGVVTEHDLEWVRRDIRELAADGHRVPPIPFLRQHTLDGILEKIATSPSDGRLAVTPERLTDQDVADTVARVAGFAQTFHHSMLVVGGKKGTRRLVDCDDTFARYARIESRCDTGQPAHLSVYQYADDLDLFQRGNQGSAAGYRGVVWSRWLLLDLDDHEESTFRLTPCRALVAALLRLGVPRDQIMVFFSGNRGLHVMFPAAIAFAWPKVNYEYAAGTLCQFLLDEAVRTLVPLPPRSPSRVDDIGPPPDPGSSRDYDPRLHWSWHEEIDWNMYKPLAVVRAPNTPHEKTGLYKIRLELKELGRLDPEGIRNLARQPRPFEPPPWRALFDEDLVDFWRYACGAADSRPYAFGQTIDKGAWVFAETFDFLHNGATEGTRGVRIFRAAVNLLQVGCSPEAALCLLGPAAQMSGLGHKDIKQQIDGAARYLSQLRQVPAGPSIYSFSFGGPQLPKPVQECGF
jgi:hypothetical protein